jgi:hypothetical protein
MYQWYLVPQEDTVHIVLIDGEYEDRIFMEQGLAKAFPARPIISVFANVGVFLEQYERLPKPFILVLELILPLFAVEGTEDNLVRRTEKLRVRFPWLGDDWNGLRGGEVLIRGIRSIQSDLPIIVYTDIDSEEISPDVLELPELRFCGKQVEIRNLVETIHSFGIA